MGSLQLFVQVLFTTRETTLSNLQKASILVGLPSFPDLVVLKNGLSGKQTLDTLRKLRETSSSEVVFMCQKFQRLEANLFLELKN